MIKRIIDKRVKEKFLMDDVYLNGQARICGWQATLVYISLCRHSSINQESFPSIKLMCQELSIGRNTVLKGIENLEKYNVIQVKKTRSKGGQWLNNTYTLTDKSNWIKHQVPVEDTANHVPVGTPPSPSQGHDQVPVEDTKETHKQGNTYKETHTPEHSSEDIEILIKFFEGINPSSKQFYSRPPQRKACRFLVDTYGFERVKKVIELTLPRTNGLQFFPTITTPIQLQDKWATLESAIKRYQAEHKKLSTSVAF